MRVLMIPTYYGGISWWRFEVPAKALRAVGVDVTCPTAEEMSSIIKGEGDFGRWLAQEMPKHDIVHIGYTASLEAAKTPFILRDKFNIPVVTDIDDNLDKVPTYNSAWAVFRPGGVGQRIAKIQLAHSDAVTFSTEPLAKAMAYINPNHTILGNWVDVDSWDHPTPPERQQDKGIRVMVTGGNGRYGDWQILREPLEWAMRTYPNLRLFFLGATPDWVLPWMSDAKDPSKNRCFYIQPTQKVPLFNRLVRYVAPDIILSPTQKNTFNQSKSGLKFLEATLTGAAFICTDYDTYSIAPKGTCLKCDNTDTQWKESLSALIEDATLRAQLVDKARDHVLANCTAEGHIKEWVDFYQSVIERRANLANSGVNLVGREAPINQE